MGKIVITAGDKYTDIDVLACAIAYCELLTFEGKGAEAVLLGPFQNSITPKVKAWPLSYSMKKPAGSHQFVIVDCSDPKHFSDFVKGGEVVEIFDHHAGFVDYWKEKLGQNSHIELIGACATLIWEEYKKRRLDSKITISSARLLLTAIISNTLNFRASVTNNRDIVAFGELKVHANLPENWITTYFSDQDAEILKNTNEQISTDAQILKFPNSEDILVIAQIELWDGEKFIRNNLSKIRGAMKSIGYSNWFLTVPSISKGKNYIYTDDKKVQLLLADKLGVEFTGNVGITSKLILRKEIKRILYDY